MTSASETTDTVTASPHGSALDDATAAAIEATLDHLNDNHADTVLFVARHLAPGVDDAEVVRVDRTAAVFAVRDAGTTSEVRLEFPRPIDAAHEVQGHFFATLAAARAEAPADAALTSLEREMQLTATLRTVHGRVSAIERIAPALLQVTLTGFDDYPLHGGDEFVYTMISHAPGGIPTTYDMSDYRDQADDDPVRGAYYTVRRARPEAGEIDMWVVEHDHPGTVAAWMMAATPGDPVALWGPRHGFQLPDDARHVLFVADETGLAAVAALVEVLPTDRRATAILECVDAAHRPPMPAHPGLEIVWVDRGAEAPGVTNRLLGTVAATVTPGDGAPDAAFGAAESRQVSAVRRHLRQTLGMPATRVQMTGYWRRQVG
ncbi:MAG: SIP domain-containing protein [Acidimicrobiales bacterium]|nr:SIP domain-containing protein [Acidimicrobiales bacterium]